MRETKKKNYIKDIILLTILFVIVYFAYQFYQENNFNNFIRREANLYTAQFTRDDEIKFSNQRSYKIKAETFNDAMFSKEIEIKKGTPYKVTCMVKTNGVEINQTEGIKSGVGAQISICDTTERSIAITGTNDWQKIELLFNSKNREKVEVGFRLGGYLGEAKGEVWFSDIKIEEGSANEGDTEWKFACFFFENTDVIVNEKEVKIQLTNSDISNLKDTINRFEKTCKKLSDGKMKAECDIYQINTPITSLSYDNQFGYYVAPEDIENQIKDTITNNNYDHIFVIVRLGDEEHQKDIEIKDWIGLGSMDYYGVGFSNIRLPNDSKSYIYKYNEKINQFPEEVFLHEFLHSLERTAKEYGYQIPELHDFEKYGYKNEILIGQKKWYKDYMNKNVNSNIGKIGLPNKVYELKPAKQSDFKYVYDLQAFEQPENLIEEVQEIIANLKTKLEIIF